MDKGFEILISFKTAFQNFEELEGWKKFRGDLIYETVALVKTIQANERYNLSYQVFRSARLVK